MRCFVVALVSLLAVAATTEGQNTDREFPYEAVVQQDGAHVRSGPGRRYYPTGKLSRGDRVKVHRHDPGGWYMIAPPPDSFSWIRAEHVEKIAADRGAVQASNVVVRVGSSLGDTRDVEQRRLSKGAQVTILGEKTFQTEQGRIRMYKIEPPRGEYRWIAGQHVAPADAAGFGQGGGRPYSVPSPDDADESSSQTDSQDSSAESQARSSKAAGLDLSGPQLGEEASGPAEDAAVRTGPDAEELNRQRRRLSAIDDRFAAMVDREPDTWDLASLEEDYRQLQNEVSHHALQNQLLMRFGALDRYRKIQKDYEAFVGIMRETDRRDAQLAAQQGQHRQVVQQAQAPPPHPGRTARRSATGPQKRGGVPWTPSRHRQRPAGPRHAAEQPQSSSPSQPRTKGPQLLPPQTAPETAEPSERVRRSERQATRPPRRRGRVRVRRPSWMDGAGIVRRTKQRSPRRPPYVLVAPDGRLLAYLQPSRGVDLARYVGRPMGVQGRRFRDPRLQSDVIVVRKVVPVKLRPKSSHTRRPRPRQRH